MGDWAGLSSVTVKNEPSKEVGREEPELTALSYY